MVANLDILHTYWRGVLARLQAEVENMNQLIGHQGVKGAENEASLARILQQLIPSRYAVGSGLLIDSDGRSSKQMDLVVYDSGEQPALLAQTTQVLYPVETVRLCIEVKTSVGSKEIKDSREKAQSIRDLHSSRRYPKFGLFGYAAMTHATTLAANLSAENTDDGPRPDFVCIPDLGFVADGSSGMWRSAITPLLIDTEVAVGISNYSRPKDTENDAYALRGGNRYPVVTVGADAFLADPSRALLLFTEQVLNATDSAAADVMHVYLRPGMRDNLTL